jgi:hypothetical protein
MYWQAIVSLGLSQGAATGPRIPFKSELSLADFISYQ